MRPSTTLSRVAGSLMKMAATQVRAAAIAFFEVTRSMIVTSSLRKASLMALSMFLFLLCVSEFYPIQRSRHTVGDVAEVKQLVDQVGEGNRSRTSRDQSSSLKTYVPSSVEDSRRSSKASDEEVPRDLDHGWLFSAAEARLTGATSSTSTVSSAIAVVLIHVSPRARSSWCRRPW